MGGLQPKFDPAPTVTVEWRHSPTAIPGAAANTMNCGQNFEGTFLTEEDFASVHQHANAHQRLIPPQWFVSLALWRKAAAWLRQQNVRIQKTTLDEGRERLAIMREASGGRAEHLLMQWDAILKAPLETSLQKIYRILEAGGDHETTMKSSCPVIPNVPDSELEDIRSRVLALLEQRKTTP